MSQGLDTTERLNLTLSASAVAVSWTLASGAFALALALGSAIEAVNYRVLRRATERFFAGELAGSSAWTAGYGLRFVFVGVAMAAALAAGAHPVGLVLGLTMIVPSAVVAAWRTQPPTLPTFAVPPPEDPSWERWNPWLARERDPADEDDEA